MHLKCGGIFNYCFTRNLLLSLLVKEFWKSVNIWQSYRHKQSGTFLQTWRNFADIKHCKKSLWCHLLLWYCPVWSTTPASWCHC